MIDSTLPANPETSDETLARADSDAVRRVAFVSLGCPKNLVDSEKMLGTLAGAGFTLVSDHDQADAIVVNTCGFLEASKDESVAVIHEAIERKNSGCLKRVVVAGCLVQRHRAKLLEWAPGIDAMIGVFDRDHIIQAITPPPGNAALAEAGAKVEAALPKYWIAGNALQAARERGVETIGLTVNGRDGRGVGYFEDDTNRLRLTPRHWSYLRVSEGCNQRCAFCTIPSIRGKMRSKSLDAIISEARQLMADGAFELNLIGQDTTSYGYDIYPSQIDAPSTDPLRKRGIAPQVESSLTSPKRKRGIAPQVEISLTSPKRERGIPSDDHYPGDLIGLLTALNDVAADFGGGWMRLMYAYPTNFTDAMIDAMASLPNIVNYIDIPLQHISTPMLQSMRRNITRQQQESLLYKLRERIPGLAIRTTFITGFPGETDQDHQELLEFIEDFQFDLLGVFKYSREAGTPAGTMDEDPALHVPDELKIEREAEIMLLQQEIAFENAKFVAEQRSQFDVLIDRRADGGTNGLATTGVSEAGALYVGRCYHQAPQVDSVTYIHSSEPLSPGELVRCTIVDADGYDLIARPTEQLERTMRLPVIG